MVTNDPSNASTENNNPEHELNRVEALAEKLSKTDTAFGARFTQLMEFSKSIAATEKELKDQANLNKKELEGLDKRIKELSEKAISGLTTKIEKLEKAIDKHKERVDEYIKRIDTPLEHISRDQASLLHRFDLIDKALNQENKFQKGMIWAYRGALVVTAIFFVYYHFSITKDINEINNKLNNSPEKVLKNKEVETQVTPDSKLPIDNKPKSNKK
jgi:uncharacterized protein (DUF3084 family)